MTVFIYFIVFIFDIIIMSEYHLASLRHQIARKEKWWFQIGVDYVDL